MMRQAALLAILLLLSAGCSSVRHAPVSERPQAAAKAEKKPKAVAVRETDWRPEIYIVQKGDTLHGIALEHGMDYRELAEMNGLADINKIQVGQQLNLKSGQQAVTTAAAKLSTLPEGKPVGVDSVTKAQPKTPKSTSEEALGQGAPLLPPSDKTLPAETHKAANQVAEEDGQFDWGWPTSGKVIAGFNDSTSAKGIDIVGKSGQPVYASAPGKVVYSGSSLRGYGKLIIIKHNKTFLSAYAHNKAILVKEGQSVSKGQKIAEMGDSDADQVKLHFEIRRFGKPVDPAKFLSESSSGKVPETPAAPSDAVGGKRG
jgi:lipoprotein NlpD